MYKSYGGGGIGLDSIEKVLLSLDNINYETVDLKDRLELDEQGRLEINLHEDYKVKFIRLIWNSRIPVQNIQIEVLNRKFVGLMAAALQGGWGDRLISQLNAIYLAEKLGYKFAFKWEFANYIVCNANINNIELRGKEYVFSQSFIDIYHYKKIPGFNWGNSPCYRDNIPKNFYWGYYVLHSSTYDVCKEKLPNIFNSIEFSQEINNLFKKTASIVKDVNKNFITIHIRSGDIVYNKGLYMRGDAIEKTTLNEIALQLIKLNKEKTIILFGEDLEQLQNLKEYFKKQNVNIHLARDLLPKQENKTKEALQEIFFMSKASCIYGSSGFARLASLIGFGKEPTSWQKTFSKQEQLKIMNENFGKVETSNHQKSFSKFFTYTLHRELYPNDYQGMADILKQALEYLPQNVMHRWLLAECYVKMNELDKADKELKEMLIQNESLNDVFYSFNRCSLSKSLKETFANLFDPKYPYINFVIKNIKFDLQIEQIKRLETENNALKNEAKAYQESKELSKNTTTNLEDLKNKNVQLNTELSNKDKEIQSLKKDLKTLTEAPETKYKLLQIKNLELKNKKLDFEIKTTQENFRIPIYINQAQSAKNRIENHLAYKLGEAIIENSKSIWGIMRIPFVLSYISQSHHKKLANQKEQLPKIETLPDYKEAIKIKEQMTYKIGEAFIRGIKTWYKGGLIKFYFEAQKIKKEDNMV